MNSLIINGDILSICKLCVSYKHTKAAISKIKLNVVKIFSNTFSGSKNTYIARFLSSRLNQLETIPRIPIISGRSLACERALKP